MYRVKSKIYLQMYLKYKIFILIKLLLGIYRRETIQSTVSIKRKVLPYEATDTWKFLDEMRAHFLKKSSSDQRYSWKNDSKLNIVV